MLCLSLEPAGASLNFLCLPLCQTRPRRVLQWEYCGLSGVVFPILPIAGEKTARTASRRPACRVVAETRDPPKRKHHREYK